MTKHKKRENPFDEKSSKKNKVVEKINFDSLTQEEKIKHVKDNLTTGLSAKELDFYNQHVLKATNEPNKTTSTNKRVKNKPLKPSSVIPKEKAQETNSGIKDLSNLSNLVEQFPKDSSNIENSKIPEKKKKVEEAIKIIDENTETAIEKADNLEPENGKEVMQNALNEVSEKQEEIVENSESQIEKLVKGDETITPDKKENPIETKKQEMGTVMKELRTERNNLSNLVTQIEAIGQENLTEEQKLDLENSRQLVKDIDIKISKLTGELDSLNKAISIKGEKGEEEMIKALEPLIETEKEIVTQIQEAKKNLNENQLKNLTQERKIIRKVNKLNNKEQSSQNPEGLDEKIKTANSFEELYKIIEEAGGIQGTEHGTSEQIIPLIKNFVKGEGKINDITRGAGLRNKVLELVKIEEENEKKLKVELGLKIKALLDEENQIKQEYFDLLNKINLLEKNKDKFTDRNNKIQEITQNKTKIETEINKIISKNNDYENNEEYIKLKEEFDVLQKEYEDLYSEIKETKTNITIEEQERFNTLDKRRKEITQELGEKNLELEKLNNPTNEPEKNLEQEVSQKPKTINELNAQTGKTLNDLYTEKNPAKINKIEKKNEEVLSKFDSVNYLDLNDAPTENNIKGIANLQKEFFGNAKESIKNAFKKSLDWWNKDYSERTKGEKFAKSIMSAGFIGTALYLTGEKLDMLPKDTGFLGKVGSRVFMAGLASVGLSSEHAQRFAGDIKDKFSNLSKTQKVAALGVLSVAGVGAFISFAGLGALGVTGAAIGTRIATDKYIFNKKIENRNTAKSSKEQQIEKIKEEIEKIQSDKNIEKSKKELDINSLAKNLDTITKDIDKLNKELRKIKTFQSLTRGAISFAGGLGTMAVMNSAYRLNWKDILEDKPTPKIETPPVVDRPKPEEIKPIPNPENKINIPKEAIIDGKERVGITYAFRDQLIADKNLAGELGIEHDKLDDSKYVANEMKKLAIKLGYMDQEGHEIRISEDGKNKIAYVLSINPEGKAEVSEINTETGKVIETHCEGDNFEGVNHNKEYEYFENKQYSYTKTDENITQVESKTYPAPERIVNPGEVTTIAENVSDGEVKPDSLSEEEIKAPQRTFEVKDSNTYTLENLEKSPSWAGLEKENFLKFINVKNPNYTYSPEELKIFKTLENSYEDALLKEINLKTYLENNKLSVKEAKDLLYKINNENYKINIKNEDLAESKVGIKNTEKIVEKIKGDQELQEINKVADKFDYEVTVEDLKEVKKIGNQNINILFEENKDAWTKIKDVGAAKYMKAGTDSDLNNYLNKLKSLTGLKPKNGIFGIGLGKKEQIDDYINRCLLEAQKKGILSKVILEKPENEYRDSEIIIKRKVNDYDDLYR